MMSRETARKGHHDGVNEQGVKETPGTISQLPRVQALSMRWDVGLDSRMKWDSGSEVVGWEVGTERRP